MITAGGRPVAGLPRSVVTSASQFFSFSAVSSLSAAARYTVCVAAAYSAEVCTHNTALRLSSAPGPVGAATPDAGAVEADGTGVAGRSLRLQAPSPSVQARMDRARTL
jgi:hypothetical protein